MRCMDETPDLPLTLPAITYLKEITLEGQELFIELRDSGFTEKQATAIVAHFIVDAVNSRDEEYVTVMYEYSEDDDDEDDAYDDGDGS